MFVTSTTPICRIHIYIYIYIYIYIDIVHIHIYLHICRTDNVCDTTILGKCFQPLYRRLACCQEASRPFLGVIFEVPTKNLQRKIENQEGRGHYLTILVVHI